MNDKPYIGETKNGKAVYLDPCLSHAATHFKENPHMLELVREVLAKTDASGSEVAFETDLGRIIGTQDVVAVDQKDDVVYAKRKNRDNYTKFVKHRAAVASSLLSIVLRADGEDYDLWSAWIGPLTPTFPGGDNEMPASRSFWATHALVYGQAIQPDTETTEQPW